MNYEVRQIGKTTAILGEGAYWSDRRKKLYWVDIKGHKVFQTDPISGQEVKWDLPTEIGFIVEDPRSDCFLVGLRKGIAKIELVAGKPLSDIEYLSRPEDDIHGNRFNDGAIDQFGNLWAGSMDDEEERATGNWWHLPSKGEIKKLVSNFEVTNGPAFSPAGNFVFLTDSAKRTIYRATFERNGLVSDLLEWARFDSGHGYPDGMNFDRNGLLWVAFWDGGCVRALDQNGNIAVEIKLPVIRPTKVALAENQRIYVTSASLGVLQNGLNGGIFEVCLQSN